jgi:predicted phosphoribosyltransferase
MTFADRHQAGLLLAGRLDHHRGRTDVVVLGLPRGGVPVASAVAQRLEAPLEALLVRKLGVPGYEEVAMGAVAANGVLILDHGLIASLDISPDAIEAAAQRESRRIAEQERLYQPRLQPRGRCAILVDDGVATGATARAAALAVRRQGASAVVIAAPVGSRAARAALSQAADEVVFLIEPEPFRSVGMWYDDFSQVEDREVLRLLAESRAIHAADR